MDTLKTKAARPNHVVFNFVSILCISTLCHIYSKVPCTQCLGIYCCGMAAHIWGITSVSSLRFNCSCCAQALHFSRSNKWSI